MSNILSLNTNLSSLNAQRRLDSSSSTLQKSYERLSSGLRINKASDDAAGLAISSSLRTDSRVYVQGIRNLNDGISLLNIAEGGTQQLQSILIRGKELSEQAANGVLTNTQRQALQAEASALISEYNRITATTSLNGSQLLDGTYQQLDLQAGYGNNGVLSLNVGSSLLNNYGTGDLKAGVSIDTGNITGVAVGDLNGDGIQDLVQASYSGGSMSTYFGNGDGTFKVNQVLGGVAWGAPEGITLGDFNGDGRPDVAMGSNNIARVFVYLNTGNGNFGAVSMYDVSGSSRNITSGDFNNDGRADLLVNSGSASVLLSNSNGTFKAPFVAAIGGSAGNQSIRSATGDFNQDGFLDFVTSDRVNNGFDLVLGNGNGTFKAMTVIAGVSNTYHISVGDMNNDGNLDVLAPDSGGQGIWYGNSNGTFKARTNFLAVSTGFSATSDLDSDGDTDAISYAVGTTYISLNNGNGTFAVRTTTNTLSGGASGAYAADFDGDGVSDVVGYGGGISASLQNITQSTQLRNVPNIATQAGALLGLTYFTTQINKVIKELGNIGAQASRAQAALSNISQSREYIDAAAAQIDNVDVAEEAAVAARLTVLRQAGAAVLAQANQQPAIIIGLLQET